MTNETTDRHIVTEESDGGYMELPKKLRNGKVRNEIESTIVSSDEEEARNQGKEGSRARKRRKPPTAGEYVELAAKKKAYNEQLRMQDEIERAARLRELTTGELYSNMKLDLDQAVEDLKQDPTADIANRARKGLKEVLIVARTSKNLKGGCVKELKNAAVMATAALEVLRTRADNEKDTDIPRQMWALKEELKAAKKEAAHANKMIAKLQAEVNKLKEKRNRRRSGARAIISDSDSDSDTPPDKSKQKRKKDKVTFMLKESQSNEKTVLQNTHEEADDEMDIDPPNVTMEEVEEYNDEKKKKEILPPPEEWPPARRPPIQGKIKILEDRVLTGHRVKISSTKVNDDKDNTPKNKKEVESEEGVEKLLKALTPTLENWQNNSLKTFGVEKKKPDIVENKQENISAVDKKKTPGRREEKLNQDLPSQTPPALKEGWNTVVGRKEKRRNQPAKQVGKASNQNKPSIGNKNNGEKERQTRTIYNTGSQKSTQRGNIKNPNKRRPPRTAAVTLTCPPDEYASAMRKVREQIKLEDLGIEALKPRKAVTGALILEIQGPDGKNKAKALKEKMEEALREMEGTKVTRPEKMSEIRIKDIVECTDISEIKEAIAISGECPVEEIKTGEVKKSINGLGTLWAQCPIRAANKMSALGKIKIGWTYARVELLAPRQLQCYRCLEKGHVQANCTSAVDRSGLCYRCGGIGHQAKQCESPPRCLICQEKGLPASHRMGGPACKVPTKIKKLGKPNSQRISEKGSTRPAVRGGPNKSAPVPVRSSKDEELPRIGSLQEGEANMDVEMMPEIPLGKRCPRVEKGEEAPE